MKKWDLYNKLKNYYIKNGQAMPVPVFQTMTDGLSENDIHDVVMEFNHFVEEQQAFNR